MSHSIEFQFLWKFQDSFCHHICAKQVLLSFKWNLIRLGGPTHGILTKTVHKTLSGGGRSQWGRGRSVGSGLGMVGSRHGGVEGGGIKYGSGGLGVGWGQRGGGVWGVVRVSSGWCGSLGGQQCSRVWGWWGLGVVVVEGWWSLGLVGVQGRLGPSVVGSRGGGSLAVVG